MDTTNISGELIVAGKELPFQDEEKEKLAAELSFANKELIFQDKEMESQAAELSIANKELLFQNEEKEKRAAELSIANKELIFQNEEKEKRAAELIVANKELAFQNQEKEKRAEELVIANKELAFQNKEKEKRAEELIIANKELAFQNQEKEKRAEELVIANKELAFQNKEKEKRAEDLKAQQEELREVNNELHEKAQLLQLQDEKMSRINDELLLLNQHLEKRVSERTRELENLNHELKNLNLSKDKFLSVISHDLRNPLMALMIASDHLSGDIENHIFGEIQPFAKIIHSTSHNILQQLNELVDWAKTQQEKTTLNIEKINLFAAVEESFELLKVYATQKNIVFENKVPPGIYVNAQALMLRSVLQNLVTNAIKYSLQGGLVTVTAQRIDRMAEVCVIDSGIGMDTNTRENLFTNSNATSISGTNNEIGSGLGLILVKDFVVQHGGTLRVESEIKKGTCIFFTMPAY